MASAQAILINPITNKYNGEAEYRLDPIVAGWPYQRTVK